MKRKDGEMSNNEYFLAHGVGTDFADLVNKRLESGWVPKEPMMITGGKSVCFQMLVRERKVADPTMKEAKRIIAKEYQAQE